MVMNADEMRTKADLAVMAKDDDIKAVIMKIYRNIDNAARNGYYDTTENFDELDPEYRENYTAVNRILKHAGFKVNVDNKGYIFSWK
jgi:spore germination protein YaaH